MYLYHLTAASHSEKKDQLILFSAIKNIFKNICAAIPNIMFITGPNIA